MRSTSGMVVAPERSMSSRETMNTAAGVSESRSPRRETEVTSTFIRSSMLSFLSSGVCAAATAARGKVTTSAATRRAQERIISKQDL
jgi:hypothetical protein